MANVTISTKDELNKFKNEIFKTIETTKVKDMSANNEIAQKVGASPELLKQYIMHLIGIETSILFLVEQLSNLKLKRKINKIEAGKEKEKIERSFARQLQECHKQIKAEYKLVEKEAKASMQTERQVVVEMEEPKRPHFITRQKPVEPSEPVLKKFGLFNKKKIQLENEAIQRAYEATCAEYEKELREYNEYESKRSQALKEYEIQMKLYRQACKEAKKNAVQEQENELALRQEEIRGLCEQKMEQAGVDNLNALQKRFEEIPHVAVEIFLKNEVSNAKKMLNKLIKARDELYSYNIIYGKYRSHVAITKFFEYLDSNRCNCLEGSDGAYNIYEAEIRANEIITKLSSIENSLEEIKGCQYLLYSELKGMNKTLRTINGTMKDAVNLLYRINMSSAEMQSMLQDVSKNTEEIASDMKDVVTNTEITAHYSAITAHYAKMNCQLTNSLGFMIALK